MGDLRNLTTDLPAWPDQARWLEQLGTKARAGHDRVTSKPRRPFAPMGLMGLVWLSIAAAAPMPASAIPLVLLALFALWAACWKAAR